MSTRMTLAHGEDHHLFIDLFEPRKVFLTMVGTEFEARPGSVTVAIPAELWERLRAVDIPSDSWWDEEADRDDDADPPVARERDASDDVRPA